MLLDEITAALDVGNEAAVAEALGRLAGDRTVLVVAHRWPVRQATWPQPSRRTLR